MTNHEVDKYCKGCIQQTMYPKIRGLRKMRPIFKNMRCPCIDCILKANCSKMCDARIKYGYAYNAKR